MMDKDLGFLHLLHREVKATPMAGVVGADVVMEAEVEVVVVDLVAATEEDVAGEDIHISSTLMPCPDPTVCSLLNNVATPLKNGND